MRHRAVLPWLVTLAAGVLAGCSGGQPTLYEYQVTDSGTRVNVTIDACGEGPSAQVVEETPDAVRIRADIDRPSSNDCLEHASVDLAEPLGDRAVIDDRTGEPAPGVGEQ